MCGQQIHNLTSIFEVLEPFVACMFLGQENKTEKKKTEKSEITETCPVTLMFSLPYVFYKFWGKHVSETS